MQMTWTRIRLPSSQHAKEKRPKRPHTLTMLQTRKWIMEVEIEHPQVVKMTQDQLHQVTKSLAGQVTESLARRRLMKTWNG